MEKQTAKPGEQLTLIDKAIIAAFDRWITANPQGGEFIYHGYRLLVTKK